MASAAAPFLPPFSPNNKTLTSTSFPLLPTKSTFFSISSSKSSFHKWTTIKSKPIFLHCTTSTATLLTASELLRQELNLDDRELRNLLQKHPQLEFTPPEFLRCRIASLFSVNLASVDIQRVVIRCAEILTSPELTPFLEFVREELPGLQLAKLERLLTSTPPYLYAGFIPRTKILLEHGIPSQQLSHVFNNVNVSKVFCERSVRELEEMLIFLELFQWPDIILRRPAILNLDLHTQLIPRVEYLSELGDGDEAALVFLINKLPNILAYTVEHYRSHVGFWRSVGLTREQVFKIVLVYPNVFSASKERKLVPRVEFLKQCELDAGDIFKFLLRAPTFLGLSFENVSKKLGLLVKLGFRYRTREMALAMGAATRTNCENLQRVIGLFLGYGFSCEDVMLMSTKHPQTLQYQCESLEKKVEFLVEEMERDIGELMSFPAFLGYKLDDRIKKRYEEKKEIRGKGMSLNKLLSVSTKRFDKERKARGKKTGGELESLEN